MTIVWATDGSELADRALGVLRDFAKHWASPPRVVAVHIDQRSTGRAMNVPLRANEEELVGKIRSQVQQLADEGLAVALEVRLARRAADEAGLIASIARGSDADMIIVGTRGHGRFVGAVLGSVAQGLLHDAPCPVLVVPPAGEKQPTQASEKDSADATAAG